MAGEPQKQETHMKLKLATKTLVFVKPRQPIRAHESVVSVVAKAPIARAVLTKNQQRIFRGFGARPKNQLTGLPIEAANDCGGTNWTDGLDAR